MSLTGPRQETLSIEINAVDQLEQGNILTTTMGIHPTLAALEMMLYPKTVSVIRSIFLASSPFPSWMGSSPPSSSLPPVPSSAPGSCTPFAITAESRAGQRQLRWIACVSLSLCFGCSTLPLSSLIYKIRGVSCSSAVPTGFAPTMRKKKIAQLRGLKMYLQCLAAIST